MSDTSSRLKVVPWVASALMLIPTCQSFGTHHGPLIAPARSECTKRPNDPDETDNEEQKCTA